MGLSGGRGVGSVIGMSELGPPPPWEGLKAVFPPRESRQYISPKNVSECLSDTSVVSNVKALK